MEVRTRRELDKEDDEEGRRVRKQGAREREN
jgi:hypothetical protein